MSSVYFASDMHLGFPRQSESIEREKIVVKWLNDIIDDTDALYLLGDVFDFWFEYKHVVPRGYTRFLGKIAEFTDRGIPVYFFTGNHDVWIFDYLPAEIGIKVYRKPIVHHIDGTNFYLGHGDGLGDKDWSFKLLKGMFTNPVLQWLFARIHPNSAVGFGHRWSNHNRYNKGIGTETLDLPKEHLVQFIEKRESYTHSDIYIFGHRHIPIKHQIGEALYLNLGDWLTHFTYAHWDGKSISLKTYKS